MKQEFVKLPREVVERAIEALRGGETPTYRAQYDIEIDALVDLSAALEQPDAETPATVPEGWKLVPVEPNCSMVLAGERSLEQHDFLRLDSAYRAMLDAAPQPPAVEQPQSDQPAMTPIAQRKLDSLMASGYTISGYSVYHEQKHQHGFVTGAGLVGWWRPEGVEHPQPQGEQEPYGYVYGNSFWEEKNPRITDDVRRLGKPLYTHPQPKIKPLTDTKAVTMLAELTCRDPARANDYDWGYELQIIRAIENYHNIK